ncbi:hypothetical protein GCM10010254_25060 [Streptomyces chromofuscus]|nr:hypothetical protein GCM10010254_25060 [Streptomyces chromofuscus]
MTQSVTYRIDDVFAPGHVGELTQVIPTELVDAVLEETGTRERRLRSLPSRVGVYFVLALGLFEHLGAGLVWGKLVAGLAATVPQTSEKALRDLRRRIGVVPKPNGTTGRTRSGSCATGSRTPIPTCCTWTATRSADSRPTPRTSSPT